MKTFVFLIIIFPFLYGCHECGPQKEPDIKISMKGDSMTLNNIHAIGALNQEVFQNQIKRVGNNRSFNFPISLHADSSTYIFEFDTRTDTLTLFYERKFYHKEVCGFLFDITAPADSVFSKSTFSKVFVDYTTYVDTGKFLFIKSSGINVGIEL